MPQRILIVDDEEDLRAVAQLSLELMRGWEVSAASSGAEAVRRAAEELPDAILLDVMMPEMDGPTTLLRLRENPATREIPVLLLTAKVQEADRTRLSHLGVAGVLTKPFDPLTLPDEVAGALGWE